MIYVPVFNFYKGSDAVFELPEENTPPTMIRSWVRSPGKSSTFLRGTLALKRASNYSGIFIYTNPFGQINAYIAIDILRKRFVCTALRSNIPGVRGTSEKKWVAMHNRIKEYLDAMQD